MRALATHLRGHIFLFDGRPHPAYAPAAGIRLLVIFVVLELLIGPRLAVLQLLGLPVPPTWLSVPLLLAIVLFLVRFVARVGLGDIGFHGWREWSLSERSYFIQVVVLTNVIFPLLYAERLRTVVGDVGWQGTAVLMGSYFIWGFYQEVMYRGILQTELVRRWRTAAGIIVSNALFTFGPLHLYHLSDPSPVSSFAIIFAIGLFFAVLYQRSANLWIVGIFHGIGDMYFTALAS